MYSLKEIAHIVNGKLVGNPNVIIKNLITDTRRINDAQNSVFFALVTDKNNGHNYIKDAVEKNIAAAIVNKQPQTDCTYILVKDTLAALQALSKHHRKQYKYPIVGITGSNGKTIVKEWISFLLQDQFNVCKNPKSYNSQIGVPLSVWGLKNKHNLGVFEAGISKPNEMELLQDILAPSIGVFTHLGDAHSENFESDENKLNEKLKLFKESKTIICPANNLTVLNAIKKLNKNTFTWGSDAGCNLHVIPNLEGNYTVTYNSESFIINPPNLDKASIENTFTALATCLALGCKMENIAVKIESLPSIDMRLQQVSGVNGNQLILDYYNFDFKSVSIAFDFLKQQQPKADITVILSDILGSNLDKHSLYKNLNNVLVRNNVSKLIGVGTEIHLQAEEFNLPSKFYKSTAELIANYPFYELKNQTILIKGARPFEFEKIADILKTKTHQTVLEVNLTKLQHNIDVIKSILPKQTKIMAMVKALGYGSGDYQIAKKLEHNNIDYLGVAYTDEAMQLRRAGITTPIVVLNPDLNWLEPYTDYNIEPVIYSFESLNKVKKKPIKIHLEIDTGMHRLGFSKLDYPKLLKEIAQLNKTEVVAIFSHLAVADNDDKAAFTAQQIKEFKAISTEVERVLSRKIMKHLSNTAGIEKHPNALFDIVRLGIGLYGVSSKGKKSSLTPVSTFKSYITQIKTIPANEGVGYGNYDASSYGRKIAIIAVGYADGFSRKFSRGVGSFIINNKKAPVVGNVCMDMTMCDVTSIECKVGDEAIIFGNSPTVSELAKTLDTIPYEILTNVSERVTRVFFQE